jgi:hypothetical protein
VSLTLTGNGDALFHRPNRGGSRISLHTMAVPGSAILDRLTRERTQTDYLNRKSERISGPRKCRVVETCPRDVTDAFMREGAREHNVSEGENQKVAGASNR